MNSSGSCTGKRAGWGYESYFPGFNIVLNRFNSLILCCQIVPRLRIVNIFTIFKLSCNLLPLARYPSTDGRFRRVDSLTDNQVMAQVRDGEVEKLGVLFERHHQ